MGDGGAGERDEERGRLRRDGLQWRRGGGRPGGEDRWGGKHGTLVWGLEMWGRMRERVVNGGEGRAGDEKRMGKEEGKG